jgi:hypothetical protein
MEFPQSSQSVPMEFPQSSRSIPRVHKSVPIEFPKRSHRVPYHEGQRRHSYLGGLYIGAQPNLSPDPIDQYNWAYIVQSLGPQLGLKI